MKNLYGWLALIIAVSLLLMPLISNSAKQNKAAAVLVNVEKVSKDNTFKLKNAESGEITEIAAAEYLFCVVAAEMPALYHTEALKAQAVAAYTYALYKSSENKEKDYDITSSSATDQAFITREAAREKWGEKASEYEQKIDSAIKSVENLVITYNGDIILSAYTAISGGRTENAKNVWGSEIPYLTETESIGDLLCPDYLSSASFTTDEIKTLICDPKGVQTDYTTWFTNTKHSEAGTVLSMDFGSITLSGAEIREALSLRSANFDVTYTNGVFNFSVRGYGHLCGMSQYGANYMAMQGSGYKEILEWYYKGCTVSKISA